MQVRIYTYYLHPLKRDLGQAGRPNVLPTGDGTRDWMRGDGRFCWAWTASRPNIYIYAPVGYLHPPVSLHLPGNITVDKNRQKGENFI